MTAAGPALLAENGRQAARLFYLAGASLPTGNLWVVGDVTYTDRKPGVVALLYDDASGGPITVSAATNYAALGLSHALVLSGSVAGQLAVAGTFFTEAAALTSPTSFRVNPQVIERASSDGSTTLAWTNSPNAWMGASGVLVSGVSGVVVTGSITADDVLPTGGLGLQSSSVSGSITLDATLPTGQAQGFPGNTVRTLPFSRNSGARPVSLPSNAIAVLSDDAALARIAGASGLSLGVDGRLTFSDPALPAPGTTVIAVTREADGRLGVERYQVLPG
jgi:hypothetical protein